MKKLLQAGMAFSLLMLMTVVASAETTVTLTKMHLCCGKCVKGVDKAVSSVDGVTAKINSKKGTTVLSAINDDAAQKALNALAKAGFHAKTDSKTLIMKDNSGVKEGKVSRIELGGIHNCCGKCNTAILKAIASVEGVAGNNAKPNQETLVVEGNFEATELIKALFAAGFHAKAK